MAHRDGSMILRPRRLDSRALVSLVAVLGILAGCGGPPPPHREAQSRLLGSWETTLDRDMDLPMPMTLEVRKNGRFDFQPNLSKLPQAMRTRIEAANLDDVIPPPGRYAFHEDGTFDAEFGGQPFAGRWTLQNDRLNITLLPPPGESQDERIRLALEFIGKDRIAARLGPIEGGVFDDQSLRFDLLRLR